MTTEAPTKYVGTAVEEWLIAHGIKSSWLAERLNVQQFHIYRMLKGLRKAARLNEERVQQIAEVLRVDDATRTHWLQLVRDFDGPLPRPSLRRG
jgi:hypothetical protein